MGSTSHLQQKYAALRYGLHLSVLSMILCSIVDECEFCLHIKFKKFELYGARQDTVPS